MYDLVTENEAALCAAVEADLGVEAAQVYVRELALVLNDVHLFRDKLAKWAAPQKHSAPLAFKLDTVQTRAEPLGVVLIIGFVFTFVFVFCFIFVLFCFLFVFICFYLFCFWFGLF